MASPSRTREREEQRRLNARTLAIASAASATAATVTSQLWIAGTWIAAAVTPVIVAVVSELLHRPTARIARAITSDRPALRLDEPGEPAATAPRPDPDAPPSTTGRVSVYRQPPPAPRVRRRLAIGVIAATALIATAVATVALTVPELIAGQSIGKGDGATSLFGGKARKHRSQRKSTPTSTGTTPSTTETTPTETQTVTVPAPPPTTGGEPTDTSPTTTPP